MPGRRGREPPEPGAAALPAPDRPGVTVSPEVLRPGPGVRCVVADNPGPMTLDGTRTYLVGRERAVLLDPGPAGGVEARVAALAEGRRVVAVALTHAHPDHAAGARAAARLTDAPVAASAATLARAGLEGRALEDGEGLAVDGGASSLEAVATPGHAADHLCWWWPPASAVFTGDLVLGTGTAMVGHPDGHMGSYLESLERLRRLEPERLYPGHGDPVDDADGRLRDYLRHRREREEQIRRSVEEGAASVAEIRRRVYGELPDGLDFAAEASIRAHLEHLEERGVALPEMADREDDGPALH